MASRNLTFADLRSLNPARKALAWQEVNSVLLPQVAGSLRKKFFIPETIIGDVIGDVRSDILNELESGKGPDATHSVRAVFFKRAENKAKDRLRFYYGRVRKKSAVTSNKPRQSRFEGEETIMNISAVSPPEGVPELLEIFDSLEMVLPDVQKFVFQAMRRLQSGKASEILAELPSGYTIDGVTNARQQIRKKLLKMIASRGIELPWRNS